VGVGGDGDGFSAGREMGSLGLRLAVFGFLVALPARRRGLVAAGGLGFSFGAPALLPPDRVWERVVTIFFPSGFFFLVRCL